MENASESVDAKRLVVMNNKAIPNFIVYYFFAKNGIQEISVASFAA
jgi:hypothetical protein